MIKTLILSLALVMAPFVHAGDGVQAPEKSDNPEQSIFIVSDNSGTVYFNGNKVGKVKGKAWKFLEISSLVRGTYRLTFNQREFSIPVARGHDTFVRFTDGEPVIGWSESQLNLPPRLHKGLPSWAVLGIVVGGLLVTVGAVYAAGFMASGRMSM